MEQCPTGGTPVQKGLRKYWGSSWLLHINVSARCQCSTGKTLQVLLSTEEAACPWRRGLLGTLPVPQEPAEASPKHQEAKPVFFCSVPMVPSPYSI